MASAARGPGEETGLRALVSSIRQDLLSAEDSVCLERARRVTEAWKRYEREPICLRRARAFAHALRHMTLDLHSNPVFAGNTSSKPRAWMLVPEHGFGEPSQVLIENEGLAGIVEQHLPGDLREFWAGRSAGGLADPGHLAVDLDQVVNTGLIELLERLEAVAETGTAEQQTYRRAMRIGLQAVIDWAQRYAVAAESAALSEPDPLRRACLTRVAAACRRVPARPARTLFEGLQAIVLVHLALAIEGHGWSVSIGLPDRALARFAAPDLDPGEATALIAAFLLKLAANSIFGRGSKTQAVTVGGADAAGRPCSNRLTRCFLKAADLARVGDPHVFLRWHPALPQPLKRRAAELLADGLSMPLLVNDMPTAQGFIDAGVEPDDAWKYCVIGCNELGIPGLSAESASPRAGSVLYLETLNRVLLDHPAPDAVQGIDEILERLETALRQRLREAREHYAKSLERQAETAPVPFTSALMHGCIEAGDDMVRAMKYRIPGLYERQLTNGANALAAIQRLVFEKHTLKLSELVDAMRENFASEAGQRIRRQLLSAPAWGDDEAAADAWALRLLEMRERVLERVDREFGHSGHMVCHVVRSLHHLDGKRIAASPDGRCAWTPVSDSIGAGRRNNRRGPTAILNSVAKIDACTYYRGGYNLNITVHKGQITAPALAALIEAFFLQGGQELQINCVAAETLRDAQRHPEQYGDLIVRFAGLSSRFVDLAPAEQNEIIARADAM